MNKTVFVALISIIVISSCSETEANTKNASANTNNSQNVETVNQQDEKERITEKYGEQWDFCDCVKKNDSIDKLLKNQKLTDSELDNLLKRAEEIENKCKLLLTDLKSNKPVERQRHQAKVKACLEK